MAFANPVVIVDALGLSEGERVADLGCGAGYFTVAASDRVGETGAVYAVDIQSELVTKARSLDPTKRENIHFITADLEVPGSTHLGAGVVDTTLLINVLFQLSDITPALTEAVRITRPGGRLLIIDWTDSFGGLGPPEEYVVSAEAARGAAEAAGCTCEPFTQAGDHHWGLLCSRA
ncbi:methyltransferase domain-containing protein [Patescibacteria group bacterium]|jgi:ubiquinone/menaquinone biosynthesis C-methylase UbiE|nr:methyltransferase domain-containing protein [Patescibacteria group bacterium]